MQGPNVRRLITRKASLLMVPYGSGGLATAIAALAKPGNIVAKTRQATAFVRHAIAAVRMAAEPNPYKTADDEVIAGVILEEIEKQKKARRKR
jgi:hypothetical protein